MKVKFLENYGNYHRGMQYPIEQVGKEKAKELEKENIVRIFPLIDFKEKKSTKNPEPPATRIVKENGKVVKPTQKKVK